MLSSGIGQIDVETRTGASIRIVAKGLSRGDLRTERRASTLRIANTRDEEKVSLSLGVVAPPNLELVASLGEGDIEVRGAWRQVMLRTGKGTIVVDGERVDGGTVAVGRGRLEFSSREAPSDSLRCTVAKGRLSVEVPSSFRGSVNLRSEVGKIDLVEHPALAVRGDATRTSVLGWAGAKPTADELRAAGTVMRPAGIWAHVKEGRVRFRLVDPGSPD